MEEIRQDLHSVRNNGVYYHFCSLDFRKWPHTDRPQAASIPLFDTNFRAYLILKKLKAWFLDTVKKIDKELNLFYYVSWNS